MKHLTLTIIALAFASQASAQGIVCSVDGRPADGQYQEVKLQKNSSGKFDLIETTISSGFGRGRPGGGAPQPVVTTLASNLTCNVDENMLVAYCFKGSNEEKENSNSIVRISSVRKIQLHSLQGTAAPTPATAEIEVMSPILPKGEFKKEFSFQIKNQFGGCKAL